MDQNSTQTPPVNLVPPAQNPVVPLSQPVTPPPQKGFSFSPKIILTLLALLIIIVAGSGIYLSQNSPKSTPKITPTPLPTEASAKADDPTASWKIYDDSGQPFAFKYPEDYFKYQEETPEDFKYREETESVFVYLAPSKGNGGNGPKYLNPGDVWLDVSLETAYSSYDEYFNSKNQQNYSNAKKELVNLKGLSVYKITHDYPVIAENVQIYSYEGLILKDQIIYKISLSAFDSTSRENKKQVFDQIFSTFSLIHQDQERKAVLAAAILPALFAYEETNKKFPSTLTELVSSQQLKYLPTPPPNSVPKDQYGYLTCYVSGKMEAVLFTKLEYRGTYWVIKTYQHPRVFVDTGSSQIPTCP